MEYFDSIHDLLGKDIINVKYIYINYWTIVHFITGMLFGYILPKRYLFAFIIHTIYEWVEDVMYQKMRNRVLGETMTNKVWDTIAFMMGYHIIQRYQLQ